VTMGERKKVGVVALTMGTYVGRGGGERERRKIRFSTRGKRKERFKINRKKRGWKRGNVCKRTQPLSTDWEKQEKKGSGAVGQG